MDLDLDALKARGPEIYRQHVELKPEPGGRLLGLCPFHGEKSPSFHAFTDDGHFHCFGCQAHGDVFDFVAKLESCSFPEAKQRVAERLGFSLAQSPQARSNGAGPGIPAPRAQEPRRSHENARNGGSSLGRPVACYPYVDETGEMLYEVMRFEPGENGRKKDFRQRRPDGRGGWIPGLGETRRPLYRLPQVLEATAVYVVEGEKDVHTIERLGNFVATTNSGGSSQRWREEWTEALRGKKVAIIPDADEPGRNHAQKVLEALKGEALAVVVLELPGESKDITEWVEAGGTADELRELTTAAFKAAVDADRPWWEKVGSLDDLKPRPTDWVVKSLVPEGSLVLMAGKPGAYKSFVALDLARSIAEGKPFAGTYETSPREVMYVDLENPQNIVAMRKTKLRIGSCPRLRYLGRWSDVRFAGIDSQEIRDYAKAVRPVLVFDSLIRFHSSDENDNSEMGRVMACFMELAALGATVIVLHHAAKAEGKGARGAIEIEAAPDVCYRFDRLGESQVRIKGTKNRLASEATVELELETGGFRVTVAGNAYEEDAEPYSAEWIL